MLLLQYKTQTTKLVTFTDIYVYISKKYSIVFKFTYFSLNLPIFMCIYWPKCVISCLVKHLNKSVSGGKRNRLTRIGNVEFLNFVYHKNQCIFCQILLKNF